MRKNSKDSQLVDVSFENGQSITAKYVIGADGSKSAVCIWTPSNQRSDVNFDPLDSRIIRRKLRRPQFHSWTGDQQLGADGHCRHHIR